MGGPGESRRYVLVVDDKPSVLERSYGNLVTVSSYEGDAGDEELFHLAPYLGELALLPDVRRVEKRNWRMRRGPAA